jgi:hypothetical protein
MITEAVDTSTKKSFNFIKHVATSAESKSIKEKVISDSAGKIKNFSSYRYIVKAFDILKNSNNKDIKMLEVILQHLESNEDLYSKAYTNKSRLLILEYEGGVYLLVTGLSLGLADYITKKNSSNPMITKLIEGLSREFKDKRHKIYINAILNAKDNKQVNESIEFTESVVSDTIELIKAGFGIVGSVYRFASTTLSVIKSSYLGVLPLIRSCMYLWYKRKANTILALEEQIKFLQLNIDQLKNIKNMDEVEKSEIMKKQEAIKRGMQNKAEKLRAELMEGSREATVELIKDDDEIKKNENNNDDDFILENIDLSVFEKDDEES